MVRRIFVHGLSSFTSESIIRAHFEQFGELYECVIPAAVRYSAIDTGPDDEEIEARSEIRYEKVKNSDEDLIVEPFSAEKHENFEKYMRNIGEGDQFVKLPQKHNAGYAYVTFIDLDGFVRCMKEDEHDIDNVKCFVELAKNDQNEEEKSLRIESKRLFVSFFPLDRLSSKELKGTFGAFGKISDVEFVSDNEGPLHFCIITFADAKSVDVILTKSIFIRDVRMFTRRAVLKESIKIAENRQKQAEKSIKLPLHHTAYPSRNVRTSGIPTDPSAAAGYAPLNSDNSDSFANYGYGPRKW